jgi:hypothetical protein
MDVPKYLDFDLLIERTGERYKARVISAPTGTASRTFDFPFNRDQLQIFLLSAIGLGRNRKVRKMEAPEMKAVKIFGGGLFEAVFAEDLLECLRLSLYDARRESAGLRIRLRLDDAIDSRASDATGTEEEMTAVALCDVPWEFMFDAGGAGFLSLSIDSPVVRYQDLNTPVEHISVDPPLRLLVAICAPSNAPELDVAHERAKVEEALSELVEARLMQIDWLEHATLKRLQRALYANYHAFHFIGHGGYDERAQTGALLFENANGFRDPVGAEFLRTLFQGKRSLQLALLNACEGSRTDPRDPFAGVAQSLVRGGVAAVIAMQFEISDEAAVALSSEFYSALAHGFPVDAALSEARKAVYTNVSPVEWAIPVLYLRSPDASIFDVAKRPPLDEDVIDDGPDDDDATNIPEPGPFGDSGGAGGGRGDAGGTSPVKKPFFERLSRRTKLIAAAFVALILVAAILLVVIPGAGPYEGDIVFVRNGNIFSFNPDTEGESPLVTGARADNFAPSMSPDQTQVVFGGGASDDEDIFIADIHGSARNLTKSPGVQEESADWSVDGRIVYDSYDGTDYEIFSINPDGSDRQQLTVNDWNDKRPEWSPDGNLIAYESDRDRPRLDIFVMDANGNEIRNLTKSEADDGVPVWSPDGTQIAFRSDGTVSGEYEVWIMKSGLVQDPRAVTQDIGTVRAPAWSPDGNEIVYSKGPDGKQDLSAVSVDSDHFGESRDLVTTDSNDRGPTWCCF